MVYQLNVTAWVYKVIERREGRMQALKEELLGNAKCIYCTAECVLLCGLVN